MTFEGWHDVGAIWDEMPILTVPENPMFLPHRNYPAALAAQATESLQLTAPLDFAHWLARPRPPLVVDLAGDLPARCAQLAANDEMRRTTSQPPHAWTWTPDGPFWVREVLRHHAERIAKAERIANLYAGVPTCDH